MSMHRMYVVYSVYTIYNLMRLLYKRRFILATAHKLELPIWRHTYTSRHNAIGWFPHGLFTILFAPYTLVLRLTFIVCDCNFLALLHWILLMMKMFDCICFVQAFKECKKCTFQRMEMEFKEANYCWNSFYLRFLPFFPIFYRCWFDLKLQWVKQKTMDKKSNT